MIHNNFDIRGEVVADTQVYKITDNTDLDSMVVSKTVLHALQETRGHSHEDQEEVYVFTRGRGRMHVGGDLYDVKNGDTVLIPLNTFHKVVNTSTSDLEFLSIFQGTRNH